MKGKLDNIHPTLMEDLEEIERRVRQELTITSGYREPKRNEKVGGVSGSEHTYFPAEGVDIRVANGRERFHLVVAALEQGITRIGVYNKHIHLGMGKDKPKDVIWTGTSK